MQGPKPRLDRLSQQQAILDVAQARFLAEGYAGASMATIAEGLGGSKATLYNYYRDKRELFAAYVRRRCAWEETRTPRLDFGGKDFAETLRQIGRTNLRRLAGIESLPHLRLVIAEAARFPDLSRAYFDAGILGDVARVADALSEGRDLKPGLDRQAAARQYLALCSAHHLMRCLADPELALTEEQIDADVAVALQIFLAIVRAPSPGRDEA